MRGISVFGVFGVFGVLAACGEVHPEAPDAGIDAAIDAAIDGPPAPLYRRAVIDRQRLPTNNTEARAFGADLNGDGVVDNQLGQVLGALAGQGFNVQATADTAVSKGQVLMLAEANVASPNAATFTLYSGANPQPTPCAGTTDTVCRRHLMGTGTFSVAANSAHDMPLVGTIANGTFTAGPGHLQIQLVLGAGAPVALDLIGARVKIEGVSDAGFAQSVIAGAVSQTQLDTKVYPGLQQSFAAIVAADCPTMVPPDCGCPAGSTGRTILSLFDTNPKNCVVSIDEIKNNSLIQSLLAPDVTIEGQAAISLGFAATAVKATFTP